MWMDEVAAPRGASLCRRIKRKRWGVNGWLGGTNKKRGRVCEEGQDSNSKWGDVPIVSGVYSCRVWRAGTAEQLKTQSPGFKSTMASARCCWTALFLLSVVTCGVFGRAVNTQGFVSRDEPSGQTLRTDALRRWRRAVAGTHRERCAELAAPWQENTRAAPEDDATRLQLRVRPFTPRAAQGLVFPEKSLFSFVRRVYHCCQEGLSCRSLKGIQGRLRGGKLKHTPAVELSSSFFNEARSRTQLHSLCAKIQDRTRLNAS